MTALQHTTLFRDELEALRLCDLQGLTQEEAGRSMGVSRGTVHRLLMSGRKKMIEAVVSTRAIIFQSEADVK